MTLLSSNKSYNKVLKLVNLIKAKPSFKGVDLMSQDSIEITETGLKNKLKSKTKFINYI